MNNPEWNWQDDELLSRQFQEFSQSLQTAESLARKIIKTDADPSGVWFEQPDPGVSTAVANNVLTAYERLSDECADVYRRAKRAERNQQTLLIGASIFCGVLAIVAAGGWAAWWRKKA
jgi:hypothetical protein